MPLMSEPTPLGRLLRARRQKNRVSWKRLEQAVGVEDQTMMRWERGATLDPPIGKVLLYAREVGISLEELAGVLLPSDDRNGRGDQPSAIRDSADVASLKDAKRGARSRRR